MEDLLTHDHSELDGLLAAIFAAFDANDAERIYRTTDFFWARLAMHIRAEHLHLFPALVVVLEQSKNSAEKRAPSFQTAQSAIAKLRDDHDFFMHELSSAIKQMRDWRNDDEVSENRFSGVRETIEAVKRRLDAHNELEETEVYQWAQTLFDERERARLNVKMQKEINNLPPRFDKSGTDGNL